MLIKKDNPPQMKSESTEEKAPIITIDQGYDVHGSDLAEGNIKFHRVIIEQPLHGLEIDYLVDYGATGQIRVNYASSSREWIISVEQGATFMNKFAQVSYLRYDNQGRLLEATISLDGFSSLGSAVTSQDSWQDQMKPSNPYKAMLALQVQYQQIPKIGAYFVESTDSSRELLTASDQQASKYYEGADTFFRASWQNLDQIVLEGYQDHTAMSKKCTFPLLLPIKHQTLLHEHLDQAWFPLEDIHWSTYF